MLSVKQLVVQYRTRRNAKTVLDGINITVDTGDPVSVIGPSGCGKSTLLHTIAGYIRPTAGIIEINGYRVSGPGPDRGVVLQSPTLYPWLTVMENVSLGLKLSGNLNTEGIQQVQQILDLVGIADAAHQHPHELSGGMQQRAAVARAMVMKPEILLMDEPFGALDALTRQTMQFEFIKLWKNTGVTVLLVTHDVDEALLLSRRIIILNKIGHIIGDEQCRILDNLGAGELSEEEKLRVMGTDTYLLMRKRINKYIFEGGNETLSAEPVTSNHR